mmetsp:Transcript_14470/g.17598  ORF Transcript_14470/g.17598 Transcript_14470/m.17598 type:complete len:555 (+) Transcript_14470:265-1929(+)
MIPLHRSHKRIAKTTYLYLFYILNTAWNRHQTSAFTSFITPSNNLKYKSVQNNYGDMTNRQQHSLRMSTVLNEIIGLEGESSSSSSLGKRRKTKIRRMNSQTTSPKATTKRRRKTSRTKLIKSEKRSHKTSSSSLSRTSNVLLNKEEEINLTLAIRELKRVICIRDELSIHKTANNPGSSHLSYLPNPMYKYQSTELESPYKVQPTEQEWSKACNISVNKLRRILVGGREARKRLVDGNIGLVTQIAKKYAYHLRESVNGFDNIGTIITLGDLIQEGNLGLMEAAERFDPKKGFRFGTYAVYWVKSRIIRCITDNSRTIRLPAHVHSTLRTIRKTKSEMQKEIGREPSMPELAHHLQMPLSKLQLYTDSSLPVLSLEVPLNNGRSSSKSGSSEADKRTLMDKIASDSPTPQEDAEIESLRSDIRAAIDGLGNDRERDVLLNRFGLEDGTPRTFEETANRLGISRDRVRSLEARALNKLRHPQRNYMLKEYVGNGGYNDDSYGYHDTSDDFDTRRHHNNHSHKQLNRDGGKRITHLGASTGDTLNQFTPEKIWSF